MEKINSINLLSNLECEKTSSIVYSLKESWIHRHAFAPYYTLGAASYLDAKKNSHNYYDLAELNNLILIKSLDWFYQKLVKTLEIYLQAPVKLTNAKALPGFHIYLGFKLFELSVAPVHYDLQYNLLDWNEIEQIDFNNPVSFTLPIALPKKGSGLNLWDITLTGRDALQTNENKQELGKQIIKKKTFHPYRLGEMIIHSGLTAHQAIIGDDLKEGEDRITLQGHALFSQGSWQLYW